MRAAVNRGPYLAIALAIVAVSCATPLIQSTQSPTLVVAAWRMLLASVILLPFALRAPDLWTLSRRDLGLLAATGLVLAVHFAAWITSLKEAAVPTVSSLVLVTSHPLLVAAASTILFRERLRPLTLAGVGLGLAGVAVIALGGPSATFLGNSLAFLGGVMAGIYLLAGRHLRKRLSLATYAFVVYAIAAVALFSGTVLSGISPLPVGGGAEWLVLLGLAGISQIGGHTLYNWALKHVPATLVSVSLLGEPIGGTLLSAVFLGTVVPQFAAIGAMLALPGIVVTAYSLQRGKADSVPVAEKTK